MLRLSLDGSKDGLNLLFLGAHCDDIEIGCGGTILRLLRDYDIAHVRWVVFSSNAQRKQEASNCARAFLEGVDSAKIDVLEFQDGYFSRQYKEIKDYYEGLKSDFQPDVIFTHYQHDLHQDHRLLSELAWNTFRNHLILEYEIPKYDGDLGNPNVFVNLDEALVKQKVAKLMEHYGSQRSKHWFDEETFISLVRLRGMQSACRYAEGFYSRKLTI